MLENGGTRASNIRTDSNATIFISEPIQGEIGRNVTISGNLGQIQRAQFLLKEYEKEANFEQDVIQMTISKNFSSFILANEGTRINKIRSESNAIIRISEPIAKGDSTGSRILTISGSQKQIQKAQLLLKEDYDEKEITISNKFAGFILGKKDTQGDNRMKIMRSDSKAIIAISDLIHGSGKRILSISGNQRQIQRAQFLLQEYENEAMEEKDETIQINIPKKLTGAIIGIDGSKISQIRSYSEANITIDGDENGSNGIIRITGSPEQVQTAKAMLPPWVSLSGHHPGLSNDARSVAAVGSCLPPKKKCQSLEASNNITISSSGGIFISRNFCYFTKTKNFF